MPYKYQRDSPPFAQRASLAMGCCGSKKKGPGATLPVVVEPITEVYDPPKASELSCSLELLLGAHGCGISPPGPFAPRICHRTQSPRRPGQDGVEMG